MVLMINGFVEHDWIQYFFDLPSFCFKVSMKSLRIAGGYSSLRIASDWEWWGVFVASWFWKAYHLTYKKPMYRGQTNICKNLSEMVGKIVFQKIAHFGASIKNKKTTVLCFTIIYFKLCSRQVAHVEDVYSNFLEECHISWSCLYWLHIWVGLISGYNSL